MYEYKKLGSMILLIIISVIIWNATSLFSVVILGYPIAIIVYIVGLICITKKYN